MTGGENMTYGYARVSTKGQARDGNSLEGQCASLKEAGAEEIFYDSFTGTKIDRPEFDKLKELLSPGDKLIVTKLDRFARSAVQGSELIESLIQKGVTVHILNLGVMDNTPTGKLIRTIMLGFAEFERDMIIQRTQEGKEIARSKGIRVDGRPRKNIPADELRELKRKKEDGELSVKECCQRLGISRASWYNYTKVI
jgi:DNA invertase Pin-like site-specific DNA recombinase